MNKQELVAKIAKDTGSSKAGAAAAVDSMIEGITTSLKKGDSIVFAGLQDQRQAAPGSGPAILIFPINVDVLTI